MVWSGRRPGRSLARTMAYTNHTLLPEALEKWPVRYFRLLLPRLLEIIFEINARFLAEVARRWPGDNERLSRMSLIEEGPDPMVRMAHLAIVAGFSVNGVAALHSRLLAEGLFRDFYELWPHKFNNKTNGVTPRRWLALCNPGLSRLLNESIGAGWEVDLERLRGLIPLAGDKAFRRALASGKAGQQGAPGATCGGRVRGAVRSAITFRCAGQTHSRVQTPIAEHTACHSSLRPDQARGY